MSDSVTRFVHFIVRRFFRRVEVAGLEQLPKDGGGIYVAWHPNGLIDPALILTQSPYPVIFGARHGLFKWPGLGRLMRAAGAVPIYRASDAKGSAEERRAANAKSLSALASAIAEGKFSALFPEGVSHDDPHLRQIKSGAARLYYQARQMMTEGAPTIVPVGLHYDEKRVFRSHALVWFHSPVELPRHLDVTPSPGDSDEVMRERARELTEVLHTSLTEAVRPTEDWQTHFLMHRASKLIRAERAARAGRRLSMPKMEERELAFARIWIGYRELSLVQPDAVSALRAEVERYDEDMRAMKLRDHELDGSPRLGSIWLPVLLFLQVILVYLVMPPILIVGYIVNAPPALILMLLSRLASSQYKDEATVKVLAGAVLLPLTWVGAGVLAAYAHTQVNALWPVLPSSPVLTGVTVAVLGMLGGMIALRYLRLARETARAIRVRLTRHQRRACVARLRIEREKLHDAMVQMVAGVELPGAVDSSGRVVRAPTGTTSE